MKLSIVSTLYHSSPHLKEFYVRATAAAQKFASADYEIILVNDGSPDDSLRLAVELAKTDYHLVVVDLSRNFGHHKAMMTGLSYAIGDQVFLVDSDLEEEPEWLLSFNEQFKKETCDVVYGVQKKRKGKFFEQLTGAIFYHLFRFLSGVNVPSNITVARLMSRRYVDALLLHRESEVFMAGLWVITGFDQKPFLVIKHSLSKTTYTLRKKISQLVNSVTSFSNTPLKAIFFIGFSIFFVSFVYAAYLVWRWFFLQRPPSGYTSLMVSVWLLGGMIMAFIGVVGIYLAKIYSETKRRPYSIVRHVYRCVNDKEGQE